MPQPAEPVAGSASIRSVSAVVAGRASDAERARALAARLGLGLHLGTPNPNTYLLLVERGRVMLQTPAQVGGQPIVVDFADPRLRYRRLHGGGLRQPIARAVGLRANRRIRIIDATAGLGRDAFVLASLGAEIDLLERSPVLAALLSDGLERGHADPELGPILTRMRVIETDAVAYLRHLDQGQHPDVIYLDPMYPPRGKSAKVKKEMVALQAVIGPDGDARQLLDLSLTVARHRVVVKRPANAPPLSSRAPDASTGASSTRFDIYLTHRPKTQGD